jgi:hypothetical protein
MVRCRQLWIPGRDQAVYRGDRHQIAGQESWALISYLECLVWDEAELVMPWPLTAKRCRLVSPTSHWAWQLGLKS